MSRAAAVALFLVAFAPVGAAHAQDATDLRPVVARLDALRIANGLPPLTRDARLDAAAQSHSDDMATHDLLAHESPRTGDPATRVAAAGVRAAALSENVAAEQTATAAHGRLEGSAEHRANMLARDVTHYGLGVAVGPRGAYLTEVFARIDAPVPTPVAPPAAPAQVLTPVPAGPAASATVVVSPTTVAVDGASPTGRPVIGYWVFGHGIWWYFPLPADAQPGQTLAPVPMPPGVAPPGYAPTAQRVTIPAPVVQAPPPLAPPPLRRARAWRRR